MTVIVNEAALALFFEKDPRVVALVEGNAARIVEKAQQNIRDYFKSAPSLNVDQDVGFDMEGSTAKIGIRPDPGVSGRKAKLMADKQADGSFPWLSRALDAARE